MRQVYITGFRMVHPLTSFLYFIGLCWIIMLQLHPAITGGVLIALIMLAIQLRQGGKLVRYSAWYVLAATIVIGMNAWMVHRGAHILFYLMDQPVTLESLLYGGQNALTLVSMLIIFLSYQETITPQKFLYLFARISPKAALMVTMAVRFVPTLARRLRSIAEVQRTRGIDPKRGTLRYRSRHAMLQLQILLTWSLEEAVQTADSMLARGYGSGQRSAFQPYRFTARDIAFTMAAMMLMAVVLFLWYRGWGRLDIYPVLKNLAWGYKHTTAALAAWLYAGLPLLLEGRENIRWRKLKSAA